ncbi:MAG TPA: SDR family oxidoreductase [bacterium]|nr:SDR family oxidoreductase [bacterium]
MARLDRQTAVITGASSGIGKAVAYALTEEGATVVLAARREERLETLAQHLDARGHNTVVIPTDVTVREEVNELINTAGKVTGKIDILVNNAGVMLLGRMADRPVEEWRQMVEVNVMGALYCIKAILPIMLEQQSGHIVNISSIAGRRVPNPNSAVYSGTKFFLNAVTEGLRQEVTQNGIRVVSVEPGMVDTELAEHVRDKAIRESILNMQDFKMLEARDIAEAVRYAVTQPPHVNVNEILIRPTDQQR